MSDPITVSASDLVKPLATSMPEVTASSIPPGKTELETAPESAPPVSASESKPAAAQAMGVDSRGIAFDPKKFRPEKDILGRWKTLGGGKPKGSGRNPESRKPDTGSETKPAAESASVIPPDEPETPASAIPAGNGEDRFALAAEAYLMAAYSLLDGAFAGKGEWMPDDQAEHNALRNSLAVWLRVRNSEDLPPGAAFALAALGFSAKRFQRPNTSTRWRMWWLWLRAKWGNSRATAKLASISVQASPAQ